MNHKLINGLFVLALGLAGCAPSFFNSKSGETTAPRAWFDAPLPGTIFTPPGPCQIVGHGASPNGIQTFELSINDVPTSIPSPDTQSSLVILTRNCGVSEPGTYVLRLRVQDNSGGWSGFAETSLIIPGETPTASPPATEAPVIATPTFTATPTPTFTPTLPPIGGVSVENISTSLVYIGQRSCGPLDVAITARATAPKGITAVVLFYRFEPGSPSGFENVAMNPVGGDLFQRTLNPTSIFGGSIPFDQATLQYQIVVQQTDGDTSLRTPVKADIAVQACGSVTPACSSYTDKRSCQAHGCKWASKPGIVPVFVCQNP